MRQLDDNRAVAAGRGVATGRPPTSPIVEVGGLNVTYGDFHAVKDLSFDMARSNVRNIRAL